LQFGNFWDFSEKFRKTQKIWEIPKLTLSRKTQKHGGHATPERALTRLKISSRIVLGDSASSSEVKKSRLQPIWENLGKFGEIWGNLGKFGKIWEFGNFSQKFRKL
jgi:hypothetical protein